MTMNKKRLCCCGTSLPGVRFIEVFPYNAIPSGAIEVAGTVSYWIRLAAPTTVSDSTVIFKASGTATLQRSEEHTSELQSHSDLVCRLLLEKKKITTSTRQE